MKSRMNKKLILMVLAMALALISVFLPMRAEAAGNNERTATKVTFGTKYYGRITSRNTEDWYKIVLPSSGQLTIRFQSEMKHVYVNCYDTLDVDFCHIDECYPLNNTTKIKNKTFTYEAIAGTYYFFVEEEDYTGNYNFTVSFKSSGETFLNGTDTSGKYHQDDTRQTANKISLGKTYRGHFAENEMSDYYKFTLNKRSNIVLTASGNEDRLHFVLYDGEGEYLMGYYSYRNSSTGGTDLKETMTLNKGSYYLVADGDTSANYSFLLKDTASGWKKTNGKWWYQYDDGTWPAGRFATIGGKVYYFNGSGYMVTGWKQIGSYWYFFDKSTGVRKVGWLYSTGKWYYFNTSGVMKTGWLKQNGKWYYFNKDGVMVTGTVTISGKSYKFSTDGVCMNP